MHGNLSAQTFNNYASGPKVFHCDEGMIAVFENQCYLHTYHALQVRGILEIVLVIWSVIYLAIAARENLDYKEVENLLAMP